MQTIYSLYHQIFKKLLNHLVVCFCILFATSCSYLPSSSTEAAETNLPRETSSATDKQGTSKSTETKDSSQKTLAVDTKLLEPIDGIGLQQWAMINNAITYLNGNEQEALKPYNIPVTEYRKINELWRERIAKDIQLTNAYTQHYFNASQGRFASAGKAIAAATQEGVRLKGEPPVPLEKWAEIREFLTAQAKVIQSAETVNKLLSPYGLSFYEWHIVDSWWSKRMQEASLERDFATFNKIQSTLEVYRGRFSRQFLP